MQIVTITATSASLYPLTQSPLTQSGVFYVFFQNPCLSADFVTLTETEQTDPPVVSYSGTTVTFTYNPFTISPSYCLETVVCDSVAPATASVPCQDLVAGQLSWTYTVNDYIQKLVAPGDYVFTYDVIVSTAV